MALHDEMNEDNVNDLHEITQLANVTKNDLLSGRLTKSRKEMVSCAFIRMQELANRLVDRNIKD